VNWGVQIGEGRSTRRSWIAALIGAISIALSGCNTLQGAAGLNSPPSATVQDAGEVKYYPSDEPLKLALEYFERGDFGLAQRYFQDAVTKAPKDATAWVGLAATYDRIGRFDLADQAYASAIKLSGETVQILNNQGYSYMLRGDLRKARAKFLKAKAKEPANPTIINNLALLDSSSRFVRRAPEP
jgi:Flp pilus assembly protein TadD